MTIEELTSSTAFMLLRWVVTLAALVGSAFIAFFNYGVLVLERESKSKAEPTSTPSMISGNFVPLAAWACPLSLTYGMSWPYWVFWGLMYFLDPGTWLFYKLPFILAGIIWGMLGDILGWCLWPLRRVWQCFR